MTARKKTAPPQGTKALNTWIDADLLDRLDALAVQERRTRRAQLEIILEQALKGAST